MNTQIQSRTKYTEDLLAQATDLWSRGFNISTNLYAEMTQAGIDVDRHKALTPTKQTTLNGVN